MRLNFYEQPDTCIGILSSLLEQSNLTAQYVRSFGSVGLPSVKDVLDLAVGERTRPIRKIQCYWAILNKAGFEADEERLKGLGLSARHTKHFDPHFKSDLRDAAYGGSAPAAPSSLNKLRRELEKVNAFRLENPDSDLLRSSSSGKDLFDPDDVALLNFLAPPSGNGPIMLRPFRNYHSAHADDFIGNILSLLDQGKTVILDLGNASDQIRQYFSDMLSKAVFSHQEEKFTSDSLNQHFIQLYFEEAHNLFPRDSGDFSGVYARFAKEGAKFHIGMVYSTQSPSTINRELLAQTENFFVAHMSSQDEANSLAKLQVAFEGLQQDILRTRTPGYMRMLTFSHRFIIPVQANKFEISGEDNAV